MIELAGEGDLLDTLYFGWSDRPYARATLAILIKVAATLNREMDCRGHGTGKIDDPTVESMLQWTDDALQRVIHTEPNPDFRPHRVKVIWTDLLDGERIPPFFAFVDGANALRAHPVFGDLDILAALGQKAYARPSGERYDDGELGLTARRAEALGLVLVDWSRLATKNVFRCGVADPDRRTGWAGPSQDVAVGTLARLARYSEPRPGFDLVLPTIEDPVDGESLAASLARRAMLRGATRRPTYGITNWTPPIANGLLEYRPAALRAAMWAQAFDGQRLALVESWRDVSPDEDGLPGSSILIHPAQAETIAHTSLDMQRLAQFIGEYNVRPIFALAVGRETICSAGESGCPQPQFDTWAPWVQPIWESLVARQISFDVVSEHADEKALRELYRVVFPLRREECTEPGDVIVKIERRLAQVEEHVYRLTARELDGMIAKDMYVRVGRTPGGKACVAVVNLTDRPRVIKLRGKPEIGSSRDVIADQLIPEPDQRLELAPWQVRILWPTE